MRVFNLDHNPNPGHGWSGGSPLRDDVTGQDGPVTIYGTDGTEGIVVNSTDTLVFAFGGGDIVYGGSGVDTIYGGDGDDQIQGWAVHRDRADEFYGEAGDDYIQVFIHAEAGRSVLDGGEGIDTLDVWAYHSGVEFRLSLSGDSDALLNGDARMRLSGFEKLDFKGSTARDVIRGGDLSDTIEGWGGRDRLKGGAGDDFIRPWLSAPTEGTLVDGGKGNDLMDCLVGGAPVVFAVGRKATLTLGDLSVRVVSIEQVSLRTGASNDTLAGGGLGDSLTSQDGRDELTGRGGDDVLDSGEGRDRGYGGLGNDKMYGGDNSDKLQGGAGNDTVYGSGADSLYGGLGDDRLVVGGGTTTMTGGRGADVFAIASPYGVDGRVTDFVQGEDIIDFSEVDPYPFAYWADFEFIGEAAFTTYGQVRAVVDAVAGTTTIMATRDDDVAAELTLVLTGVFTLTEADFLL